MHVTKLRSPQSGSWLGPQPATAIHRYWDLFGPHYSSGSYDVRADGENSVMAGTIASHHDPPPYSPRIRTFLELERQILNL